MFSSEWELKYIEGVAQSLGHCLRAQFNNDDLHVAKNSKPFSAKQTFLQFFSRQPIAVPDQRIPHVDGILKAAVMLDQRCRKMIPDNIHLPQFRQSSRESEAAAIAYAAVLKNNLNLRLAVDSLVLVINGTEEGIFFTTISFFKNSNESFLRKKVEEPNGICIPGERDVLFFEKETEITQLASEVETVISSAAYGFILLLGFFAKELLTQWPSLIEATMISEFYVCSIPEKKKEIAYKIFYPLFATIQSFPLLAQSYHCKSKKYLDSVPFIFLGLETDSIFVRLYSASQTLESKTFNFWKEKNVQWKNLVYFIQTVWLKYID